MQPLHTLVPLANSVLSVPHSKNTVTVTHILGDLSHRFTKADHSSKDQRYMVRNLTDCGKGK